MQEKVVIDALVVRWSSRAVYEVICTFARKNEAKKDLPQENQTRTAQNQLGKSKEPLRVDLKTWKQEI